MPYLTHAKSCACPLCQQVSANALPVTQADRDTFAALWASWISDRDGEAAKLRAGQDGNHGSPRWVALQAIAAARITATQHGAAKQMEAAGDLAREALEAVRLTEAAEDAHSNCAECEGEGVPESCPTCFPLCDEARLRRRRVLALAGILPREFADGIAGIPAA